MKRKLTHATFVLTRRLRTIAAAQGVVHARHKVLLRAMRDARKSKTYVQQIRAEERLSAAQEHAAKLELRFVIDAIDWFGVDLEQVAQLDVYPVAKDDKEGT